MRVGAWGSLIVLAWAFTAEARVVKFNPTCLAILASLTANLEDDTARLVLADGIEEAGDPKFAAAIRADVEAERLRRAEPYSRETALAVIHAKTMARHFPFHNNIRVKRGVPIALACSAQRDLDEYVPKLWKAYPSLLNLKLIPSRNGLSYEEDTLSFLETTTLPKGLDLGSWRVTHPRRWVRLSRAPVASELQSLKIPRFENDSISPGTEFLGSDSHFRNVRHLDLTSSPHFLVSLANLGKRAAMAESLTALTVGTVDTVQRNGGRSALARVATGDAFPKLTHLNVIGAEQLRVLFSTRDTTSRVTHLTYEATLGAPFPLDDLLSEDSPLSQLTRLRVQSFHEAESQPGMFLRATPFANRLTEMSLSTRLPLATLMELFTDASPYRSLKKIHLACPTFSADSFAQLVRWAGAESLEELVLEDVDTESVFGRRAFLRALTQTEGRLKNLRVLRIKQSRAFASVGGILAALQHWPLADQLHTLEISGLQWRIRKGDLKPLTKTGFLRNLVSLRLPKAENGHAPFLPWARLALTELRLLDLRDLESGAEIAAEIARNRVVYPNLRIVIHARGRIHRNPVE